jgi:hypothetical protein
LALLLVLSGAASAWGQDTARCNAAYEKADLLVHSSTADQLIEAREQVRVCASPTCKAWMAKDCTQWLSEVERRIPTVVFAAKDGDGTDLTDVTVSVENKTIAQRLDGRALEMNPGARLFVFVTADGRRVEQRALVKEGEKAQVVTATFPKAAGQAAHAPPTALPAIPPQTTVEPSGRVPWQTVGWITGGVGVAGLALGSVLGMMAISKNGDSNANGHCDATGCDAQGRSLRDTALSDATASTVAFVAGGALVAAGLVLVWVGRPEGKTTGWLELAPTAAPGGAGLQLRGAL